MWPDLLTQPDLAAKNQKKFTKIQDSRYLDGIMTWKWRNMTKKLAPSGHDKCFFSFMGKMDKGVLFINSKILFCRFLNVLFRLFKRISAV